MQQPQHVDGDPTMKDSSENLLAVEVGSEGVCWHSSTPVPWSATCVCCVLLKLCARCCSCAVAPFVSVVRIHPEGSVERTISYQGKVPG